MELNTEKCYLLLNSSDEIGNLCINNASHVDLLGINFDYKLNFERHTEDIFQKASRKVNALSKLPPYIDIANRLTVTLTYFFVL